MEPTKKTEDHRIRMTVDELRSIEPYPQENYYYYNFEVKLIHPLFEKIGKPKSEEELFVELSEGQQYFYSNVEFCAQVINGGVAQYFYNSHRKFVQYTICSFQKIGYEHLGLELKSVYDFYTQNKEQFEGLRASDYFSQFSKLINGDKFNRNFFNEIDNMQEKMVEYILDNSKDFIKD